jgi:CBS domain-containing protein
MDLVGKAKRVRIYVDEDDVIGLKRTPYAVLDWLAGERAAGATLFRGTAGLGASGKVRVDVPPEIGAPAVIEWIDTPDRVERLLPRLKDMLRRGLVTVEDVDVALHSAADLRGFSPGATVAEVMSRDATSVSPDTPLRKTVELLQGKVYRAVPVVQDGRPVGIITNLDLVDRGGLLGHTEHLGKLTQQGMAAVLTKLDAERKTARNVMTPSPATVLQTASLTEAGELMVRRRLKRLPVVDAAGKLVGMVSRLDLLRTVAAGFESGSAEPRVPGLHADVPLSRVMRKDVPTLRLDSPLPDVLQAVVSSRANRALVVDGDRRVVGIVTDEELLARLSPAVRISALRFLVHRLPFSNVSKSELEDEQRARARKASELMLTDVAVAREDQTVGDAVAPMMRAPHKLVAVVDANGRLVGAVDRADLLGGLLGTPA